LDGGTVRRTGKKVSFILVKIIRYFGQNFLLFWSKLSFILVKIILYFGQNYPLFWSKLSFISPIS
jgi:hypothetical protein